MRGGKKTDLKKKGKNDHKKGKKERDQGVRCAEEKRNRPVLHVSAGERSEKRGRKRRSLQRAGAKKKKTADLVDLREKRNGNMDAYKKRRGTAKRKKVTEKPFFTGRRKRQKREAIASSPKVPSGLSPTLKKEKTPHP